MNHQIETERLILRPFTAEDDAVIMRISSDPETVKYLFFWGRPGKTPRQDTDRFLYEHALKEWQREPVRMREYALVLKETGEVIGDASIEKYDAEKGEIGWILLPEYRGHGYATEAAKRLLRFGFEELGLRVILAECDIRNPASFHVMERAGMHLHEVRNEGRPDKGDGIRADELEYRIDRADWWWSEYGGDSYVKKTRQKIGHDVLTFVGASVFVVRDGKVLLQRRKDDGKWCSNGGANEPGEDVRDTAIRELKEETGLTAGSVRLAGVYSGREQFATYPNGDMAWIVDTVWLCEDFTGELMPQECEVSDLKWFPVDDVPPREEWTGHVWKQWQDCRKLLK
ncbi:MAG: hypothetical protein CW338_06645 [Clostridiales bacterium]|nr:hypothetical protein [Clostridiales bacterium]